MCCGTFEFRNILEIVIIPPPPSSSYTRDSSPTRRKAAPSTHIIRGVFLQATSRLFGCHWDCLKRICLSAVYSRGAGIREKGKQITMSA